MCLLFHFLFSGHRHRHPSSLVFASYSLFTTSFSCQTKPSSLFSFLFAFCSQTTPSLLFIFHALSTLLFISAAGQFVLFKGILGHKTIIAWNVDVEDGSSYLYATKIAALTVTDDGIQGQDVEIRLEKDSSGLPLHVIEKFPHIRDYRAFKVPPALDAKNLLKCQLAVAAFN